MMLVPKNRHLLVEIVEDNTETTSTILVPEDYKVASLKQYQTVNIIATSPHSLDYDAGQRAVVEGHRIKTVSVDGATYQLVLENAVLALLDDEEAV